MRKPPYLILIALLVFIISLSGCTGMPPVTAARSPQQSAQAAARSPRQSVQAAAASPAIRPIDELVRPEYDVRTSILWDLNSDGTRETISIGQGDAQEIGYDILLSVSDNGAFNTVTVGNGYFETADYMTTAGGAFCVIVSFSGENDYSSTTLVSFGGLTPTLHGSVEGIAEGGAGAGWIATDSYVDVLGTWPCINVYKVTDQFTFERQGDFYIRTGCDPLITKIPLPAEMWIDSEDNKVTLKAGTSIIPYSTDGKTYMEIGMKDYYAPGENGAGKIYFTIKDGQFFIDGKSEYDCFETVPYAG